MYYSLRSKQTLQLIQNYEFSQGFSWKALLVVFKCFKQGDLTYTIQNVMCWKSTETNLQDKKLKFSFQFLSTLFSSERTKLINWKFWMPLSYILIKQSYICFQRFSFRILSCMFQHFKAFFCSREQKHG